MPIQFHFRKAVVLFFSTGLLLNCSHSPPKPPWEQYASPHPNRVPSSESCEVFYETIHPDHLLLLESKGFKMIHTPKWAHLKIKRLGQYALKKSFRDFIPLFKRKSQQLTFHFRFDHFSKKDLFQNGTLIQNTDSLLSCQSLNQKLSLLSQKRTRLLNITEKTLTTKAHYGESFLALEELEYKALRKGFDFKSLQSSYAFLRQRLKREVFSSDFNSSDTFDQFTQKLHGLKLLILAEGAQNYCKGQTTLKGFFDRSCLNCVGETVLYLSLFTDLGIQPPGSWVFGAQEYNNHLAPVLFNTKTHKVLDLVTYRSQHQPEGPILSIDGLLLAGLSQHGALLLEDASHFQHLPSRTLYYPNTRWTPRLKHTSHPVSSFHSEGRIDILPTTLYPHFSLINFPGEVPEFSKRSELALLTPPTKFQVEQNEQLSSTKTQSNHPLHRWNPFSQKRPKRTARSFQEQNFNFDIPKDALNSLIPKEKKIFKQMQASGKISPAAFKTFGFPKIHHLLHNFNPKSKDLVPTLYAKMENSSSVSKIIDIDSNKRHLTIYFSNRATVNNFNSLSTKQRYEHLHKHLSLQLPFFEQSLAEFRNQLCEISENQTIPHFNFEKFKSVFKILENFSFFNNPTPLNPLTLTDRSTHQRYQFKILKNFFMKSKTEGLKTMRCAFRLSKYLAQNTENSIQLFEQNIPNFKNFILSITHWSHYIIQTGIDEPPVFTSFPPTEGFSSLFSNEEKNHIYRPLLQLFLNLLNDKKLLYVSTERDTSQNLRELIQRHQVSATYIQSPKGPLLNLPKLPFDCSGKSGLQHQGPFAFDCGASKKQTPPVTEPLQLLDFQDRLTNPNIIPYLFLAASQHQGVKVSNKPLLKAQNVLKLSYLWEAEYNSTLQNLQSLDSIFNYTNQVLQITATITGLLQSPLLPFWKQNLEHQQLHQKYCNTPTQYRKLVLSQAPPNHNLVPAWSLTSPFLSSLFLLLKNHKVKFPTAIPLVNQQTLASETPGFKLPYPLFVPKENSLESRHQYTYLNPKHTQKLGYTTLTKRILIKAYASELSSDFFTCLYYDKSSKKNHVELYSFEPALDTSHLPKRLQEINHRYKFNERKVINSQ